jgi:DNA-binding transcriptional MerR regulator
MEEEDLIPIGEAARRAGMNASAVRYYEQRGIIAPAAHRGAARMYGPDQLRHLAFIQAGRRLGMSLEDIAAFLHGPPNRWRGIVRARIAALEVQIRQAEQARDYLGHALQCPSEHPVDECPHLRATLDSQLAGLGGMS